MERGGLSHEVLWMGKDSHCSRTSETWAENETAEEVTAMQEPQTMEGKKDSEKTVENIILIR